MKWYDWLMWPWYVLLASWALLKMDEYEAQIRTCRADRPHWDRCAECPHLVFCAQQEADEFIASHWEEMGEAVMSYA